MWNVRFVYVQQFNDERSFVQTWRNMFAVQSSTCAHGGERPKQITWRRLPSPWTPGPSTLRPKVSTRGCRLPPHSSGGNCGEDSHNCGEESQEKETSMAFTVHHTPEQRRKRATSLFAVEDLTRSNLCGLITKGKSHVTAQRLDFAKKLACWSTERVTEEARYITTLPQYAQKVLKGKKPVACSQAFSRVWVP